MIRPLGLLRTVLAAAVVAVLVPWGTGSATADEGTSEPIRVYLDAMSPAIPDAGDTLRLRGRIINTSDSPLTDVQIRLRRASAPVTARADLSALAELGMTVTPDTEVTREPTDVPLASTSIEVTDTLDPGELGAFSLRVPVSAIGFSSPGSYPIALEVLTDGDVRSGMLRTFVPWVPSGTTVEPISLAWLWPLASWPAESVSGVLLDDQIPQELASQGRLGQLLSIGEKHPGTVSWIADPSLLQIADEMSGGYRVVQDDLEVVGAADAVAQDWLARLRDETSDGRLLVLPYADVDASALTRGGMSTDVVRAVTRGPRITSAVMGQDAAGGIYWAPSGRVDRPALDVLASAGVRAVVLSADAMPALDAEAVLDGQATAQLPTDFGTVRAVLTDPELTGILELPARTASDVIAARQRFLAETATVALTLSTDDRTLVVAPSDVRWSPVASLVSPLLRATRSASWLEPVSLPTLLEQPAPDTARRRGGYGEKAREAELPRQQVAAIGRMTEALDAFTSIIDNPVGITEPFSEALLRSASTGWRSQPLRGRELLDSIRAELGDETARVRVLSEGTVTLSGESGRVPVTIANDLDRSVTVGVVLRSLPSLRLSSEPVEDISIEAGRMASLDLEASVVGGEPLAVQVQLLGPDGQEYGKPGTMTLVSTAYARAASWVVAAAFIAIVVFVIVGVTRRIRKAHATSRERAVDS